MRIVLWLTLVAAVFGQVPLTPGAGQYCSYYFSGFDPNSAVYLGTNGDVYIFTGNNEGDWTDCSIGSLWSNICFDQANSLKACPWKAGQYCYQPMPYTLCGDSGCFCDAAQTSSACTFGCATLSSCTNLPANAYFTGPADPSTSPTGCPYACNSGFRLQGSVCVPLPTTTPIPTTTPASCQSGYYLSGGSCQACTLCPTGQYKAQCGGSSAGVCMNCNNTTG